MPMSPLPTLCVHDISPENTKQFKCNIYKWTGKVFYQTKYELKSKHIKSYQHMIAINKENNPLMNAIHQIIV